MKLNYLVLSINTVVPWHYKSVNYDFLTQKNTSLVNNYTIYICYNFLIKHVVEGQGRSGNMMWMT